MRNFNMFLIMIIIGAFGWTYAQEKIVSSKSKTGVYANNIREIYEQPIIMITPLDRLIVLTTKGNFYQVQTQAGVIGWVEKSKVVTIGKNKTFSFNETEIIGYLDNPTPIYIIDSDNPNAERIYLDRSFKDALHDNMDRETVERQIK